MLRGYNGSLLAMLETVIDEWTDDAALGDVFQQFVSPRNTRSLTHVSLVRLTCAPTLANGFKLGGLVSIWRGAALR